MARKVVHRVTFVSCIIFISLPYSPNIVEESQVPKYLNAIFFCRFKLKIL